MNTMAALVHMVAPYYSTWCGLDTAKWKDRAFRTHNAVDKVTCTKCLYSIKNLADIRIGQLAEERAAKRAS